MTQGSNATTQPRFLGPVGATLFVVCFTVGTAILLVPGLVARNAGSVGLSLGLWALGGVLSLCGALCYAELAVRVPKSGSEYRYLHAGYGPPLALLALAGVGLWLGGNANLPQQATSSQWQFTQLATAMVAVIWAFDGISSVATIAGEVREPRRTLPMSLLAPIAIVTSIYPLMIIALFAAMRLRRRDGPPPQFSMPFYPLPLLVYGCAIVAICVASAIDDPLGAVFGTLVPLSGALVYWTWLGRARR